jgi:gliding motility-associated-like protein
MRILIAISVVCIFLFASCAKEEVSGFDNQITIAQDYNVDAATGDTFYRFYMPSAFTPNSDGVNDIYIVYGIGFIDDDFEMKIFSREGNLMYYTDDTNNGFDGRVQGHSNLSAQQLYNVEVSVKDTSGEMHHYVYKIAALF